MGDLRCVDGSLLGVAAIPCHDRSGRPYEVTLRLVLDRRPFAIVGQRCGHQLAALAAQVQAARQDPEQAQCWPDPDDRFPVPAAPAAPDAPAAQGVPAQAGTRHTANAAAGGGLAGFQPGEREYFTLRSRDRGDLPGHGEVRCLLRSTAQWGEHGGHAGGDRPAFGYWRLSRRAVVEAWGDCGTGVRAVLTSAELVRFLDTVLSEPDGSALAGPPPASAPAGQLPGRPGWPAWRQRGRVPDGSARSRLPALRAAARGVALAVGNPQARGSDVRR